MGGSEEKQSAGISVEAYEQHDRETEHVQL